MVQNAPLSYFSTPELYLKQKGQGDQEGRLAIDGAGYHHKLNSKWLLGTRDKSELVSMLLELLPWHDRKIVITRPGAITLTLSPADTDGAAWLKKASPTSASVDELESEIRARLALPEHADKTEVVPKGHQQRLSPIDFHPAVRESHATIGASVGLHEELHGV
jgi:hypothetical protein